MTKVIDGVHVLTFEEWKKLLAVVELEETLEDDECDECEGKGTHVCDCGDEHDCGFCDGTGSANGNDLKSIYESELRDELKKFIEWRAKYKLPTQ